MADFCNDFRVEVGQYRVRVTGAPEKLKSRRNEEIDYEKYNAIICIRDKGKDCHCLSKAVREGQDVLLVRVHDPPTPEEARKVAAQFRDVMREMVRCSYRDLYIHCEYGMSRSVGLLLMLVREVLNTTFYGAYTYVKRYSEPYVSIAPFDFMEHEELDEELHKKKEE